DEDFRGLFIARADEAPAAPGELAGKTVCFTSATALAGTLQPLMWLHDQGVNVRSLKIRYVGSQFSSILNAWGGEFAACGSTSRFFRNWAHNNADKAKDIKVLWRTPSLPHNAVVVRDDVPADVANRVARALAELDKDPSVDQSQFHFDQQHFELADNGTYKPVIEFLRRYDEVIGLPEQIKLPKNR
ncbi:MAG: PhnD/SsuA/transferrin family substrate-binding protein, partial [Rhodocyclaceae bacterium]|nr:PhnD/SsuA/transferrin family substrate-binding protein [Rhodocyclaceae bacterium]